MKAWMSSSFVGIPLRTAELVAIECVKSMFNLLSTLAPTFLIKSSSFLQVRRKAILSEMSSNFSPIRRRTAELAVLERLKNSPIDL